MEMAIRCDLHPSLLCIYRFFNVSYLCVCYSYAALVRPMLFEYELLNLITIIVSVLAKMIKPLFDEDKARQPRPFKGCMTYRTATSLK